MHFEEQENNSNEIQEDKALKGGWGQIRNASESADLADKSAGYPVQSEFHINKSFFKHSVIQIKVLFM